MTTTAPRPATRTRRAVDLRRPVRRVTGLFHGFTDWVGVAFLLFFLLLATVGQLVSGSPYTLDAPGAVAPSWAHWLGTDSLGRDVFARTASGAWASLVISVGSVLLGLLIALPLGLVAGYYHRRRADEGIMRSLEVIQALPTIIFGMFVLMLLGNAPIELGPVTIGMEPRIVLCLGLAFVPLFARVVRASTIEEIQEDYVSCLTVLGVRGRVIIFGEILVNVLPQVLTQVFLGMAIAIFAEGGLDFLGLGVQPPAPTLGNLVGEASTQLLGGAWWYALFPGMVMVIGILGFNLVGDAVNDAILGTTTSTN